MNNGIQNRFSLICYTCNKVQIRIFYVIILKNDGVMPAWKKTIFFQIALQLAAQVPKFSILNKKEQISLFYI